MAEQTAVRRSAAVAARAWPGATLHWPEYLIEVVCLGLFMLSACAFGTLLEHPASPVRQAIDDPALRRVPMGLAMGLTAIVLIYSRMGQRSGAHMNPSVTLTFLRLGKIARADALAYILAQLVGGIVGVQAAAVVLRETLGHPAVNHVATLPGPSGLLVAFGAELLISCLLMLVVLAVSNTPRLAHLTGLCAGLLVMTYIVVEAPVSGMSMNPARSLGSAVAAQAWGGLWLYFVAPPLGMLLAAELYVRLRGLGGVHCAKLQHPRAGPCIFECGRSAHSRKEDR
jgi:aquaporin Z